MRFKVKNSNLFSVPENPHMVHLGTIGYGLREFWVMACVLGSKKGKVYIEEYVPNMRNFNEDIFGNFKYIEDDNLAFDLTRFAEDKGLTNIGNRMMESLEVGQKGLAILRHEGKEI